MQTAACLAELDNMQTLVEQGCDIPVQMNAGDDDIGAFAVVVTKLPDIDRTDQSPVGLLHLERAVSETLRIETPMSSLSVGARGAPANPPGAAGGPRGQGVGGPGEP